MCSRSHVAVGYTHLKIRAYTSIRTFGRFWLKYELTEHVGLIPINLVSQVTEALVARIP